MNIRKNIDYTDMYAALDSAMEKNLSQVELYFEIGKAVCQRTEKGAAVAAAAYLSEQYPDIQGFSPRNLRWMRVFYRTYEDQPALLSLALRLCWTQNVVILEADLTMELRAWYLKAVLQFGWSKAELLDKIANQAHESLVLAVQPTACNHGKTGRSAQADNPYKSSFSRYRLLQWKNPCRQYGSIPDVYDRLLLIPLRVCLRPMDRPPLDAGAGHKRRRASASDSQCSQYCATFRKVLAPHPPRRDTAGRSSDPVPFPYERWPDPPLHESADLCLDGAPNRFPPGTEYTLLSIADDSPSKA